MPKDNQDRIYHEALQRANYLAKAQSNLLDFYNHMHNAPLPSLDFKHALKMAHHLMVIDYIQRLFDGEFTKLAIILPFGTGKSYLASVAAPLAYWCKYPQAQILTGSCTETLAEEFGRRRRSAMQTAEYKQVGPQLGTRQSASLVDNAVGGTIYARGVNGSVLGFRSNLSILDDYISSHEQGQSITQNDKIYNWYMSNWRSRLVEGGKEIIACTRWNRRDLLGRLLEEEGDDWTILKLPLLCNDPNDLLNRKLNECLWPALYPKKRVKRLQEDKTAFKTYYQCEPAVSDGQWLSEERVEIRQSAPPMEKLRLFLAGDLAITEGSQYSDFTAWTVLGQHESGHMHILEVIRSRQTPLKSVIQLFRLVVEWGIREVLLDDDNNSKMFQAMCQQHVLANPGIQKFNVRLLPTKGIDKETRAAPLRNLFHQGRVIMYEKEWTQVLLTELYQFPDGKHDDMVDCLSLGARRMIESGNYHPSPQQITNNPFAGMLLTDKTDDDGRQVSNMTLDDLYEEKSKGKILSIARRRI